MYIIKCLLLTLTICTGTFLLIYKDPLIKFPAIISFLISRLSSHLCELSATLGSVADNCNCTLKCSNVYKKHINSRVLYGTDYLCSAQPQLEGSSLTICMSILCNPC